MNTKRAVFMAVIVVAIAALIAPLRGMNVNASGSKASPSAFARSNAGRIGALPAAPSQEAVTENPAGSSVQAAQGKISPDVIKALGFQRTRKSPKEIAAKL